MTTEKFYQLIHQPSQVDSGHVQQLSEVLDQFPYFQTARLLHAKGLNNSKSFLYNDELKKTAIYAADRKVLYNLINSGAPEIQETVADEIVADEIAVEEIIIEENTPFAEPALEQPAIAEPVLIFDTGNTIDETENDFVETKENVISAEPEAISYNVEETEETISQPEIKPEITEEKKPTLEEILAQRLAEINKRSESVEIKEPIIDSPIENNYALNDNIVEEENVVEEIKNNTEPEIENTIAANFSISLQDTTTEIHSFTGWLHKLTATTDADPAERFGLPTEKLAEDRTKIFLTESSDSEKKTPVSFTEQPFAETEIKISSTPALPIDLIERFIKNEPRIEPGKTKFYSPANVAKNSAIDQSDLVSETLAVIYFNQGNLSKAIQTYEKLCLRYPEKNAFFAARILEIKTGMKNGI